MKKFKYTAVNLAGKKFNGTYLAENEKDLREKLAKQSLYLMNARVVSDKSPNPFFSVSGKGSVADLANFSRQFSIIINAGSSIVDALRILKGQAYTSYFKKIIDMVYERVKAGKLLSEALAEHKRVFPNFYVSMVHVGELSGKIDEVLIAVADYLEADQKMRNKTKSALAYPAFLVVMAIGIIVLMIAFIIPTFQNSLAALDVEMPALTLWLMALGDGFRAYWKQIVLVIVAIVAVFLIIIHTRRGRYYWDKFKFKMPYFGNITRANCTARFCRAFSLLISSGMDIAEAMDETEIVLGNKYVCEQFKKATTDVRQGMSLTLALQSYKIFPTMLVQMVSVGENTGDLETVLSRSIGFFEDQAERAVTRVTSILQPVILIIIGAAVGVLFYAVYSPMLQVMNTLG